MLPPGELNEQQTPDNISLIHHHPSQDFKTYTEFCFIITVETDLIFVKKTFTTSAVPSSFFCSRSHSCASCAVWLIPGCDWLATSHSSSSHAIAFKYNDKQESYKTLSYR